MNTKTIETVAIDSVTIESDAPVTTQEFLRKAFGIDSVIHTRASQDSTSGFRGFSLSLVYEQPADVDRAFAAAVGEGAEELKPIEKSFWGYGGSLRSPDGTVWTVASSSKKNTGEARGKVDQVVLLVGVTDPRVSKDFYSEHGLTVKRSFGAKYVEFDTGAHVTLALQSRRAVAKNAGVDPDGSGSHRLVISGSIGSLIDSDGFVWE